eukprot:93961-Prorocentrum_minimum.AAC.2
MITPGFYSFPHKLAMQYSLNQGRKEKRATLTLPRLNRTVFPRSKLFRCPLAKGWFAPPCRMVPSPPDWVCRLRPIGICEEDEHVCIQTGNHATGEGCGNTPGKSIQLKVNLTH